MKQYIDKDAVVAEIDRIKKEECPTDSYEGRCKLLWFEQFLSFLNTLEVKESPVDAFIKKACEWLKENKDHPLIGCEDICLSGYLTDEFIEDFKNYMKGE